MLGPSSASMSIEVVEVTHASGEVIPCSEINIQCDHDPNSLNVGIE